MPFPKASRFKRLLCRHSRQQECPKAEPDHPSSRLLSLPAELRQQIWQYVLHTEPGSRSPHFHIYDEVYDSCTYKLEDLQPDRQTCRQESISTSLLRTRRSIYYEAVQYLYDNTHFELVVLAGSARPDTLYEFPTRKRTQYKSCGDNISTRNCLGPLLQCSHFRRIRHATVIFQAAESVGLWKYHCRVQDFLKAMDDFERLKTLAFKFNFEYDGRARGYSEHSKRVYGMLCGTLSPYGHRLRRQGTVVKLNCLYAPTHGLVLPNAALAHVSKAFLNNYNFKSHNTVDRSPWDEDAHPCLKRGAFGELMPPPTITHQAIGWILCVWLAPIVVPLKVGIDLGRKQKGVKILDSSRPYVFY